MRLVTSVSMFWVKLLGDPHTQFVPRWPYHGSDHDHGLLSQLRMCSCKEDCSCLLPSLACLLAADLGILADIASC